MTKKYNGPTVLKFGENKAMIKSFELTNLQPPRPKFQIQSDFDKEIMLEQRWFSPPTATVTVKRLDWEMSFGPVTEDIFNQNFEIRLFLPPVKEWVPPNSRFILYEPKDESWCGPLGIGSYRMYTPVLKSKEGRVVKIREDGWMELELTGGEIIDIQNDIAEFPTT